MYVPPLQGLQYSSLLQVCRGHSMVQRSDLTDFLIAPMQHQCHYQLLLEVTTSHILLYVGVNATGYVECTESDV